MTARLESERTSWCGMKINDRVDPVFGTLRVSARSNPKPGTYNIYHSVEVLVT
jgi:hypothetical protein